MSGTVAMIQRSQIRLRSRYSLAEAAAMKDVFRQLFSAAGAGRRGFAFGHFYPALQKNEARFVDAETGVPLGRALILYRDAEARWLDRYVKGPAVPGVDSNYLRMIEAYIGVVAPERLELLVPDCAVSRIGTIFGSFMRDPRAFLGGYDLAVAGQGIIGLYSYRPRDALEYRVGPLRYVALIQGETPQYILVIDIQAEGGLGIEDELLNLNYGVCAPGEGFSPIIMRSFNVGERLAGVVYSDSSLVDIALRGPDRLRFDFFATGRELFHSREPSEVRSDAFLQILDVSHGPKISSELSKVYNANIFSMLSERIANIRQEYLQ
jgi:hypothetical protein